MQGYLLHKSNCSISVGVEALVIPLLKKGITMDKNNYCYENICLVKSHSQDATANMRASSLVPYATCVKGRRH